MRLEGSFSVDMPADVAWGLLEAPDRLLEGLTAGMQKVDGDSWQAIIAVPLSFGPIRYRFRWQAVERSGTQLRFRAHGDSEQNVIDLDARLALRQEDGRSRLDWRADITAGGVIASVGQRALGAVVEHQLAALLEGLAPRIE